MCAWSHVTHIHMDQKGQAGRLSLSLISPPLRMGMVSLPCSALFPMFSVSPALSPSLYVIKTELVKCRIYRTDPQLPISL